MPAKILVVDDEPQLERLILQRFRRKVKDQEYEFFFAQDLDLWSRLIEVGELGCVESVLCRIQYVPEGISGMYHQEQRQLNQLIKQCIQYRRLGKDDSALLNRAARIRPNPDSKAKPDDWAAYYFLASCLHAQKRPEARTQLLELAKRKPHKLKVWCKLATSYFFGSLD